MKSPEEITLDELFRAEPGADLKVRKGLTRVKNAVANGLDAKTAADILLFYVDGRSVRFHLKAGEDQRSPYIRIYKRGVEILQAQLAKFGLKIEVRRYRYGIRLE